MVTRRLFQARSITILDTAARRSFSFRLVRILMSLARNSGNSLRLANHLERQSLLTARRKPIGLVFCPMGYSLDFSAGFSAVGSAGCSAGFSAGFSADCSAVFFDAGLAGLAAFLLADLPVFFSRCLTVISSVSVMKMWLVR